MGMIAGQSGQVHPHRASKSDEDSPSVKTFEVLWDWRVSCNQGQDSASSLSTRRPLLRLRPTTHESGLNRRGDWPRVCRKDVTMTYSFGTISQLNLQHVKPELVTSGRACDRTQFAGLLHNLWTQNCRGRGSGGSGWSQQDDAQYAFASSRWTQLGS